MPAPSYYFTHGRIASCFPSSIANIAILKAMGYKAIRVDGTTAGSNGTADGHSWAEAYIDGAVWVVNYNCLSPREHHYERSGWTIDLSGYDPDWYTK